MTKAKTIIILSVIFTFIFLFLVVAIFRWGFSPMPPPDPIPANSNLETHHPSNIKTKPPQIKKGESNLKLQYQTDSLLPLFDKMPIVPIFLTDEPILMNGSETQKGVGYTTCPTKDNPTIYLKKVFYQKANQKQLTNILKHELVHAWFCRQGVQTGHDDRFRKKFKEVGGLGN